MSGDRTRAAGRPKLQGGNRDKLEEASADRKEGTVFGQIPNDLDFNNLEKNLQDNPNINDLEKKLEESGVSFPNRTKFDHEKVENVFREKCGKQNATDAVADLKNQQEMLKECISIRVNATQIQEELEEAKKSGSMDEVFAKYCNKWPDLYECFDNATVTVRRCMSAQEQKSFNRTLDIIQELQEFMCFKDGDRLAMFVAEGGVECIQEQQEGIKECFNSTIGARLPDADDLSVATLPTFLFTNEDCEDFEKIRLCVNEALERCKDTTPANIVDASFKFLKKQMPCVAVGARAEEPKPLQTNSGYKFANSFSVMLGLLLLKL